MIDLNVRVDASKISSEFESISSTEVMIFGFNFLTSLASGLVEIKIGLYLVLACGCFNGFNQIIRLIPNKKTKSKRTLDSKCFL